MSDVKNTVIVNMDRNDYWYSIIQKGGYKVVLYCDLVSNVCYTFGGKNLSICKNIKVCEYNVDLYNTFMRKIGKMCKKKEDDSGHYFSDLDGYVSGADMVMWVTDELVKRIRFIAK